MYGASVSFSPDVLAAACFLEAAAQEDAAAPPQPARLCAGAAPSPSSSPSPSPHSLRADAAAVAAPHGIAEECLDRARAWVAAVAQSAPQYGAFSGTVPKVRACVRVGVLARACLSAAACVRRRCRDTWI